MWGGRLDVKLSYVCRAEINERTAEGDPTVGVSHVNRCPYDV
jgi:hypothetical protein